MIDVTLEKRTAFHIKFSNLYLRLLRIYYPKIPCAVGLLDHKLKSIRRLGLDEPSMQCKEKAMRQLMQNLTKEAPNMKKLYLIYKSPLDNAMRKLLEDFQQSFLARNIQLHEVKESEIWNWVCS